MPQRLGAHCWRHEPHDPSQPTLENWFSKKQQLLKSEDIKVIRGPHAAKPHARTVGHALPALQRAYAPPALPARPHMFRHVRPHMFRHVRPHMSARAGSADRLRFPTCVCASPPPSAPPARALSPTTTTNPPHPPPYNSLAPSAPPPSASSAPSPSLHPPPPSSPSPPI
jgi:hypothetical protein